MVDEKETPGLTEETEEEEEKSEKLAKEILEGEETPLPEEAPEEYLPSEEDIEVKIPAGVIDIDAIESMLDISDVLSKALAPDVSLPKLVEEIKKIRREFLRKRAQLIKKVSKKAKPKTKKSKKKLSKKK